ncbi:MAG TPA: hypothetical protein VJ140_16685 [Actinomycetota bacterium]|nr:hypothetical protein [Actinomycetota bacterium]
MRAELRMVLTDPGYRLADRACHTGSGAFGGGGGSSGTSAEAECAGELTDEEVAFRVGLRGSLGVPVGACFLDVVFDLGEAPAVGLFGSRVEHLARVAECRAGQVGRLAAAGLDVPGQDVGSGGVMLT